MITGVGHVALAVKDIENTAAALCRAFGLPPPDIRSFPDRRMKVAVVDCGPIQLELLEDLSIDGMISRFVAERGNGIHHFCLVSDDIDADLERLKQQGVPLLDPSPRAGLRGKRIAFVSPDLLGGVHVELSEP
jgi:methylmalonyl-CoA/ethylmalonyl-CoA epimerase